MSNFSHFCRCVCAKLWLQIDNCNDSHEIHFPSVAQLIYSNLLKMFNVFVCGVILYIKWQFIKSNIQVDRMAKYFDEKKQNENYICTVIYSLLKCCFGSGRAREFVSFSTRSRTYNANLAHEIPEQNTLWKESKLIAGKRIFHKRSFSISLSHSLVRSRTN